jgi:prephenate dehydrogenase
MAQRHPRHVTIVGVGLLGGSAAMAIREAHPGVAIAGVGRRQSSLDEALKRGAIDTAHLDAAEPARRSDLVILATPVGAFEKHLRALAGVLKPAAAVTDVGSTKAAVVRMAARALGRGGPFVGSHPMAGSEKKGVAFARADLFRGATCIVTPTRQTPAGVVGRIERLWGSLGMRVVRMTPARHDKAMAAVSHLPHVLASLLMMLPRRADLDVAATGLRDATRLAGGDAEMWRDILLTNRRAILDAIDAFDEDLCHFRDLVEVGDAPGIEKLLAAARKRREQTLRRRNHEPPVAME